jgi:hypothetical protein
LNSATVDLLAAEVDGIVAGKYAHRVEGLQPGVYRHWPERGELERIGSGDQRVAARVLGFPEGCYS